jgi:hypothetical protein
VTAENPQHVVFIDSRVPDIQDLLDGLQPAEQAFVIDPSSDGIQQIADILRANDLTGLASISIVGHGSAGAISLGSTVLDESDLSSHSAALAQIGAALGSDGSLQLYACDVVAGATGQQFIADLSQFAGGVTVDASTQVIGQTATGENWTLDALAGPVAQTGATHSVTPTTASDIATPSVPFTAAAQANFQGTLAVNNSQLMFVVDANDANGDGGIDIANSGGTTATSYAPDAPFKTTPGFRVPGRSPRIPLRTSGTSSIRFSSAMEARAAKS